MAKKKTGAVKKRSRKASKKNPKTIYRLACISCDRDDFDGVTELPKDWKDISRYQTLPQSRKEVALDDPDNSAFDWFTHLGRCPDCQKMEG